MLNRFLTSRSRKQWLGLFLIALLALGGIGTLIAILFGVPTDVASLIGLVTVGIVFVVCLGVFLWRVISQALNTD